jgi:FHA domain
MSDDQPTNDGTSDLRLLPSEEGEDSFAQRARNHTVMLSPEITKQVRARLHAQGEDLRKTVRLSSESLVEMGARPAMPDTEPDVPLSYNSSILDNSGAADPPQPSYEPIFTESRPQRHAGTVTPPLEDYAIPLNFHSSPRPSVPSDSSDRISWIRPSPIVGMLVSYDRDENGEVYELRSGRLVVTSDKGFPTGSANIFILDDSAVSLNHAVVRIGLAGDIQLLDQLSEHGTVVIRPDGSEPCLLSGDKCALFHGDIVKFGNRTFHVCVVVFHPT